MNKFVYHGSNQGGLTELRPNVSTHMENYVYATYYPFIALIFMVHSNGDLDFDLSGSGSKDDPFIFTERRENVFDCYNTSGYLYTLDAKNFKSSESLWGGEVVSTLNEQILHEEFVPNILERLYQAAGEGSIQIYRYPNKPDFIPKDDSDLIAKYIRFEEMGHIGAIDNMIGFFPHLKEETFKRLPKPEKIYFISNEESIPETLIAYNTISRAIEASNAFIRENGWIKYNVVNNKFVFEMGEFDKSKLYYYLYEISNTNAEHNSTYSFTVINPVVLQKTRIDFGKYESKIKK